MDDELTDGVATRLYSSESHYTVLGHAPHACNGELRTLRHLYTYAYQ